MLSAIARELAALPARDRKAVLAAFDPADRDRLHDAMRDTAPVPEDGTGPHSPWMEGLLAGTVDTPLTAPARTALRDAAGRASMPADRPAGRSLLQAAGGMFAPSRIR